MIRHFLLDTGPLVAFLNRRDRHHRWSVDQVGRLKPPLLTCEAVLTEASYLLRTMKNGPERMLELVERQLVLAPFRLEENVTPVVKLLSRYSSIRASLADVCLIRMSEQYADSTVVTLDADFRVYRRHGREVIPTILPPDAS